MEVNNPGLVQDESMVLVDELTKLEEQQKQTGEKIEELRERIITVAQQKGINTILGTEKRAEIRAYDKIDYPKTLEFMELLKRKGVYNDVSSIIYSKLLSKITKRQVDVEILEKIKTEQGWMVRLSKRW